MMMAPSKKPMPGLPRPGQKVRWRDPPNARACGWADVFGPGPFEVVGLQDRSEYGLATDILVLTELGVRAINEVWLALAEEPESAAGNRRSGGG
jgi:hypothetical protein